MEKKYTFAKHASKHMVIAVFALIIVVIGLTYPAGEVGQNKDIPTICSGRADISILAVLIGNGKGTGEVIPARIGLQPGRGKALIFIPPYMGIETQISIENAMAALNISDCDVLFAILNNNAQEIDGPSAGLMLATALYGLYHNMSIPNNVYGTGEVDSKGFVYPIGGVYYKVARLCELHKNFTILLPRMTWLDRKLVEYEINKRCPGSRIIEVNHINDAISTVYLNKQPKTIYDYLKSDVIEAKRVKDYTPKTKMYKAFRSVARDMVKIYMDKIYSLNLSKDEYQSMISELINTTLEKGYYYTSANTAFNEYASAESYDILKNAVPNINSNESSDKIIESIKSGVKDVYNCIDSIRNVEKVLHTGNIEYVIAAQIREGRALVSAKSAEGWLQNPKNAYGYISMEDAAEVVKKIGMAKAWCNIAKTLYTHAPEKSDNDTYIDEDEWKGLAEDTVNNVKLDGACYDDLNNVLCRNVMFLYNQSEYGAAYVESIFILSKNADKNKEFKKEKEIEAKNFTPSTLWGETYYSQAIYINRTEKPYLNLLSISMGVDKAYSTLLKTALSSGANKIEKQEAYKSMHKKTVICKQLLNVFGIKYNECKGKILDMYIIIITFIIITISALLFLYILLHSHRLR